MSRMKRPSKGSQMAEVDMSISNQMTAVDAEILEAWHRARIPVINTTHPYGLPGPRMAMFENKPAPSVHIAHEATALETRVSPRESKVAADTEPPGKIRHSETDSSSVYEDPFGEVDRLLHRWTKAAV